MIRSFFFMTSSRLIFFLRITSSTFDVYCSLNLKLACQLMKKELMLKIHIFICFFVFLHINVHSQIYIQPSTITNNLHVCFFNGKKSRKRERTNVEKKYCILQSFNIQEQETKLIIKRWTNKLPFLTRKQCR